MFGICVISQMYNKLINIHIPSCISIGARMKVNGKMKGMSAPCGTKNP